MQISNTIALVTGANRGLGLAFSRELVRRGAARVYGAARHQDQVTEPGVTPVGLDITDQARCGKSAAFSSEGLRGRVSTWRPLQPGCPIHVATSR